MNSTARLGDCAVCTGNEAKYTCPRCQIKTCSLDCVKIHKKEMECDGIKDPVPYRPISQMTDQDYRNDIILLEDTSRAISGYARDPCKNMTRHDKMLPYHLAKLRGACLKRKIYISFLPPNFSKHKNNSTFLNWKEDIIYWKIEWICSQCENFKIITERTNENNRLSQIINEFFEKYQKKLEYYNSATLNGIEILLQADKRTNGSVYQLDPSMTLKENLRNKKLIEHPIIYLVLKDCRGSLNLIESDDELEEEVNHKNRKRKFENVETETFFTYSGSEHEARN